MRYTSSRGGALVLTSLSRARAVLLAVLVVSLAAAGARARGQSGSGGGIATGVQSKAEFDVQHRPITAGGFVKTGPIVFMDVAKAAGLTSWHHKAGTPEKK